MLSDLDSIIFSTERNQCKSTMLVQMVNKFGLENGFQNMLDCMSEELTTLDTVFYLVDSIAKV